MQFSISLIVTCSVEGTSLPFRICKVSAEITQVQSKKNWQNRVILILIDRPSLALEYTNSEHLFFSFLQKMAKKG